MIKALDSPFFLTLSIRRFLCHMVSVELLPLLLPLPLSIAVAVERDIFSLYCGTTVNRALACLTLTEQRHNYSESANW
jgi:hypothetical protein